MSETQGSFDPAQSLAAIQTSLDQHKGLLKLILSHLDQIETMLTPAEVDPDQIPLNQLLEEIVRQMGEHGRLLQLILKNQENPEAFHSPIMNGRA